MRARRTEQRSLYDSAYPDHDTGRALAAMSDLLDEHPEFLEWIAADVDRGGPSSRGRAGLPCEVVLRCGILKHLRRMDHRDLEFALLDSDSARRFARVDPLGPPKRSALQRCIAAVRPATWEEINRALMGAARRDGIEEGRRVRIDSTVTETDIIEPSDSQLLYDAVRVLSRLLVRGREKLGSDVFPFDDHRRLAKRRKWKIPKALRRPPRPAPRTREDRARAAPLPAPQGPRPAPPRRDRRGHQLQGAARSRPLPRPAPRLRPVDPGRPDGADQRADWIGQVLHRVRARPPGLPHRHLDALLPRLPPPRRTLPRTGRRVVSQGRPAARPDLAPRPRRLGARLALGTGTPRPPRGPRRPLRAARHDPGQPGPRRALARGRRRSHLRRRHPRQTGQQRLPHRPQRRLDETALRLDEGARGRPRRRLMHRRAGRGTPPRRLSPAIAGGDGRKDGSERPVWPPGRPRGRSGSVRIRSIRAKPPVSRAKPDSQSAVKALRTPPPYLHPSRKPPRARPPSTPDHRRALDEDPLEPLDFNPATRSPSTAAEPTVHQGHRNPPESAIGLAEQAIGISGMRTQADAEQPYRRYPGLIKARPRLPPSNPWTSRIALIKNR